VSLTFYSSLRPEGPQVPIIALGRHAFGAGWFTCDPAQSPSAEMFTSKITNPRSGQV